MGVHRAGGTASAAGRSRVRAAWDTVWTAAQYAGDEAVHLEAEERLEREREEARRREAAEAQARWEQQREEQAQAGGEHQAAIQALLDRQAGLEGPAFEFVPQETGFYPFLPDHGSAQFAMGVPVYIGMTPYGVVCPVASRVCVLRDRLASLVVFVASERERRRIAAQARPGQRIEVLDGDSDASPSSRSLAGQQVLPLPGQQPGS